MLSRRGNDHGPGTQGGIVARGFNGQARPRRKKLDELVLPFGRLVDKDDHGRIEIGW
jgi:hypothetical protein